MLRGTSAEALDDGARTPELMRWRWDWRGALEFSGFYGILISIIRVVVAAVATATSAAVFRFVTVDC